MKKNPINSTKPLISGIIHRFIGSSVRLLSVWHSVRGISRAEFSPYADLSSDPRRFVSIPDRFNFAATRAIAGIRRFRRSLFSTLLSLPLLLGLATGVQAQQLLPVITLDTATEPLMLGDARTFTVKLNKQPAGYQRYVHVRLTTQTKGSYRFMLGNEPFAFLYQEVYGAVHWGRDRNWFDTRGVESTRLHTYDMMIPRDMWNVGYKVKIVGRTRSTRTNGKLVFDTDLKSDMLIVQINDDLEMDNGFERQIIRQIHATHGHMEIPVCPYESTRITTRTEKGMHTVMQGCLNVTEGSTATYNLKLHQAPKAGETFTVTPSVDYTWPYRNFGPETRYGDVTFSPASVTWTRADWLKPGGKTRTITVRAPHDADLLDENFTIRHSFSGPFHDQRTHPYPNKGRNDGTIPAFDLVARVIDNDTTPGLNAPAQEVTSAPTETVANLQVTAVQDSTAQVTWDAVEHATSYEVSWEAENGQSFQAGVLPSVTGTLTTIQHNAPEAMTLTVTVTPQYVDGNGVTQSLDTLASSATLAVGPGSDAQSAPSAQAAPIETPVCVSDSLLSDVTGYAGETWRESPDHVERWSRVLSAFGVDTAYNHNPMTVAEAQAQADRGLARWTPIVPALQCLETAPQEVQQPAQEEQPTPPPVPELSLSTGSAVDEGSNATFTLTANPAPATDLTVGFTVSQSGDYLDAPGSGQRTVTLSAGATSAALSVATLDDSLDEPDGSVTATLDAGTGYTIAASPNHTASVTVSDNDVTVSSGPTLSIGDATLHENQRSGYFTITLSEALQWPVTFHYATQDSTPVSARAGQDYIAWQRAWKLRSTINPGQTEKKVYVRLYNDNHDEDPETFQMVIFDAGVSGSDVTVSIANSTATGTIINDDPMPQAWLTRFGRTVAQQAIDGLSDRIADSRTAGMQGSVAGQTFGQASGQAESVLSSTYSMNEDSGHDRHYFGGTQSQSYDMTVREALLGSSFTATGEKDTQGGSVSFWGRATQGNFDGREGTFSLDGETTTALLGTDYAKDNWLVGLTLIQSDGEGSYTDTDTDNRVPEQLCDQAMPAQARQVLCNGAVREGDGEVEASLTAITPYASIQASDSIQLWGTLGQGSGEVTLQPELGDAISSDISWSMAAMGMRGDLLEQEQGLSLALTADALWSRTESDKTHQLAASNASTTRIRAGLESSWKKNLANGQLTPRLEVGIRQDGGDAETGTGLEIGGGIAWNDTTLGLSLDLSGRTLVSHDSDDLEDRGYGASFVFDPQPDSQRGLSLTVGQDWGGQSTGGLDALFAEPVSERTGSASESRWHAQAAYGFSMLSGQFTGSPYIGTGITDSTQEYNLGWRLQPVYTTDRAVTFTLDVQATHRETDDNEPTQFVGVEAGVRW